MNDPHGSPASTARPADVYTREYYLSQSVELLQATLKAFEPDLYIAIRKRIIMRNMRKMNYLQRILARLLDKVRSSKDELEATEEYLDLYLEPLFLRCGEDAYALALLLLDQGHMVEALEYLKIATEHVPSDQYMNKLKEVDDLLRQ